MKFKRNIYMIIISIILYFALILCYKKFIVKDEFSYAYCLTRSVSRGDMILENDLMKIKISNKISDKYLNSISENSYYGDDYAEGIILLKNMVLSKEEYTKAKLNNEIISIELNLPEDAASYQIEKGSIINIFYSAKLSEIDKIYNSINKESVISNDLESGYVTLKVFDNIKIINCFDKYGNVTKKGNVTQSILIEVSKDESIKINNLKNYGKFSVSIIR